MGGKEMVKAVKLADIAEKLNVSVVTVLSLIHI